MVKLLTAALGALVAVTLGTGALVAGAWAVVDPSGTGAGGSPVAAAGAAGRAPAVPAAWEALDQRAAATCPGLPWTVLAAIGRVESDSGQSSAPGVWSGANAAGAEGPMQFEPATFAQYATVGPGGAVPASPYDPVDAVYTAAALLCANGGRSDDGLAAAVWAYNHSTVYVDTVVVLAAGLASDPQEDSGAATAIAFAAGQLGVPYQWGGTGDGGWDCSGLVQAAYRAAGVSLPRVAQDQYDAGPPVPAGSPLLPGDLLFFGSGPAEVEHVGISIGGGDMIDAPHTGAVVRVEPAGWDDLVGATRPA